MDPVIEIWGSFDGVTWVLLREGESSVVYRYLRERRDGNVIRERKIQ